MKISSVLMILGVIVVLTLLGILSESSEKKCDNGDLEACTLLEEQAKKDEERRWEVARETGERQREAARVAAEEKRKGFHCLSAWNGAHKGIEKHLQKSLKDPDSYEHIETRITPVGPKQKHTLFMKYRARNGFGGYTIGNLTALVNNYGCDATIIRNE